MNGRILAMGGGGFTMGERSTALDRLVLELTGRRLPRVCFLPTAGGDAREQVVRFHERFGDWPCEPSVLSLFHLARDRIDPVAYLLKQDAIYVGGGSMRNLLAIWREHRLDRAMRDAWRGGAVLAGLSAGAMCWFRAGVSMSGGAPEVVRGLGLLPGSLSVHRDGEPRRWPFYRAAIAAGGVGPGYAADDGAALVFEGVSLVECVASRAGASVVHVSPDGGGGVREEPMTVRLLDGAADARAVPPRAVSELRELRAGGRRWV